MRKTLLVGSMPFDNEEAAMSIALRTIGDSLICLPDGEIGEKTEDYPRGKRAAWVMTAIDACSKDHSNWDVIRASVVDENGFPVDYDAVQKLRPRRSPAKMYPFLDFGYDRYFAESYPIFQKLRKKKRLPELKFQVGIPTGLGIALSMLKPIDALRYTTVFNQRLALEINRVLQAAGDDVVIQLEVPAELALAYKLPSVLMGFALRSIFGLLNELSPATIGIHICFGDLNNKALVHPATLKKMVEFSNRMIRDWPASHRLAYVHYPLAEAATPPQSVASYYEPLREIYLPAGTRFVAGLVHEKHAVSDTQKIVSVIEGLRGENVDIATSCGLGRRSEETAKSLINKMSIVINS